MSEAAPLAGVAWSSSLSVAEAASVRQAGFEPRGLVMGSAVYQLGVSYSPQQYYEMSYGPGQGWWQSQRYQFPGWLKYYQPGDVGWGRSWGQGLGYGMPVALCWERTPYEDGVEKAAALALERLDHETRQLGAHGVVGTRLHFRYLPEMSSTIEFTAVGTAITRPGAPPAARPFTSHLTGQELLKLLQAGMVPVAVLVGAGSVVAEVTSVGYGSSFELPPFGDAVEMSRRLACDRMRRNSRVRGTAVLGTLASTSMSGEQRGQVMSAVLTGTLVRRFARGEWDELPMAIMRLSK